MYSNTVLHPGCKSWGRYLRSSVAGFVKALADTRQAQLGLFSKMPRNQKLGILFNYFVLARSMKSYLSTSINCVWNYIFKEFGEKLALLQATV